MHASLVARKVQDIRRMLREDAEALPPFTLNIGAAFADRKESGGDLYQNASLALERAKDAEDHWSAC
jgi:GGDEF domain-containing protein